MLRTWPSALLPDRSPKRRMLVIVNPYATTVSDRLKNLVVYALQSRYSVEAIDTEKRDHATRICREAASEGYDVVVAFGGDGTVNEAANGLAGTDTPLTALPGGSTNVWARTLGIPNDVVDATEHLLRMADDFHPRARGPRAGERAPLRVLLRGRAWTPAWWSAWTPIRAARPASGPGTTATPPSGIFNRRYLVRPPRVRVIAGGRELEGVTVIIQNSDPFTYFRKRPDPGGRGRRPRQRVALAGGAAQGHAIGAADPDPAAALRAAGDGGPPPPGGEPARARHRAGRGARRQAFPVQVDGDYIGLHEEAEYRAVPRAMMAVA